MSIATMSLQQRFARSRGKYLVFAFIAVVFLYVLRHNESFLVNRADPVWSHYRLIWMWLLPHALAGACALVLAPLQFSERLRQQNQRLHRVIGYIYVISVLIAARMGFVTQFVHERTGATRSFSLAAATQATSWLVTTIIALVLVRNGKIQQHRQWMTRSFSVCLIFLEVRFLEGVTGWDQLGPAVDETTVWILNVFAWMAADLILQWQDGWARRPRSRANAQVAAD